MPMIDDSRADFGEIVLTNAFAAVMRECFGDMTDAAMEAVDLGAFNEFCADHLDDDAFGVLICGMAKVGQR